MQSRHAPQEPHTNQDEISLCVLPLLKGPAEKAKPIKAGIHYLYYHLMQKKCMYVHVHYMNVHVHYMKDLLAIDAFHTVVLLQTHLVLWCNFSYSSI